MYGGRAFGTSPYGGLNQEKPLVVFQPETFAITVTLNEPAAFTEEVSGFLSITASLKIPTVKLNPKKIVVKVNTVDISNQIDFTSLSVSNNLYSEPNSAFFEILKSSSKSYVPTAGDMIEIEDTGVLIFAGVLIKISKEPVGISERYHLEFKDWTEVLANTLVAQTYTNWIVEDIIADMFSGLPEYDLTNVSDTTVITQLVSDNIPITNALDKLAELSGKYWYVSPNKEIYFFAPATLQAPYDLTDTNVHYVQ